MSLPIKYRLTLWYVALLALILVAWGAFIAVRLRTDLYDAIDQTLAVRAAQISGGFASRGEGEFADLSESSLVGLPRGESAAQLVGRDGKIVEKSGDPIAAHPLLGAAGIAEALAGRDIKATRVLGTEHERFRVLGVSLPGASSRVIVVATSTEDVDASVGRLLLLLLFSAPVALAAAGGVGWFLTRKALAPVDRMAATASQIGVEQLDERLHVPPVKDELSRLALTLNGMLDRLETGVADKRRFVADASHELRTPLAVMRSEIDVSLAPGTLAPDAVEVLESARDEVDRMSRIVENLLTLTHLDEGRLQLLEKRVDLREVAAGAVAGLSSVAQSKGVEIAQAGGAVFVHADPEYLAQVTRNLIENAVKYTPPGGSVVVSVWQDGAEAGLAVRDTGAGIAADVLPHIFDRFYRADASRSRDDGGSGLGLAISKEIVEAHGGHISATSELGKGSSFSVALPVGRPSI